MLTDLTCSKCKTRFCRSHRLPELHACPHDFQKEGQAILAERNPLVAAAKIERI
jgi:predicted nucleic acid binding AN1-type Zn finger protein